MVGCKNENAEPVPDVSNIHPDFKLMRYDEAVLNIDTTDIASALESLRQEDPQFFDIYFKQVLPLRGKNMEELGASLKGFLQVEQIKELKKAVQNQYGNIDDLKSELNRAFQNYLYYFPDHQVPDVYTIISEYAYQTFIFPKVDKDGVGVGLDLFLGEDYPYQEINPQDPAFSQYLTRSYNRAHIVKKVIEMILQDQLGEVQKNQLLDYMIQNGKKLYALDKILPMTSDSIIMEFSEKNWEWVNDNELEMFAFFLNEELFYESDMMKINKYITPSPDSPGMPPAAPGRTANFIGWKIVKAFMDKHPDYTLEDLLAEKDAQKIMNESKYKPKRKK